MTPSALITVGLGLGFVGIATHALFRKRIGGRTGVLHRERAPWAYWLLTGSVGLSGFACFGIAALQVWADSP